MRLAAAPFLALALLAVLAPTGSSNNFACNRFVLDLQAAYVVGDTALIPDKFLWSWWIYQETNGIPGVQRGGTTMLGDVDICQLFENHDQAVF